MNVVSPLNELSGDSSGLKHTQMFFPHCGNVQDCFEILDLNNFIENVVEQVLSAVLKKVKWLS